MIHLLKQLKSDYYRQISLSCGLTNANALRLYQKLGFEKPEVSTMIFSSKNYSLTY